MEERISLKEIVVGFIKKNALFLGLVCLGSVFVLVGLVQYFSTNSSDDVTFTTSSEAEVKGASETVEQVSVDVEGEVEKPGVYTLKSGDRIQDALIKAGGLSPKADREYVSRRINQAQKVTDGMKVYIPALGEISTPSTNTSVAVPSLVSEESTSEFISGLININSASESELDTLPKVGPATAKKIITSRPYANIEELVVKKVLGQKTYEGLKDKITAE